MNFLATSIDKYISVTRTYNLPAMVSEFEKSIFKEIDYMEEVMNMKKLANNFKNVRYIKIPEAYEDFCSEKVITMELINGTGVNDLIEGDYPNINKRKIADYGVKSYFKQIMIDGFFHADPHPGNLIVTEDNKLCCIDEGMMGALNEEFKENLAELILVLISGDTSKIINQLIYMKIITPQQNTPDLRADVDDLMHRYYGAELNNMDGVMEDLLNVMVKNNVVLPREFVMIGRGIALIEDAGKKLNPEFNATAQLKKLSRKIITNKFKPKRIAKVGISYLLQLEHLAKDLPDTINSIISKLEEGKIELKIRHEGINEIANQITIALILAALIVGSSLALLEDTGPRIFDMPLLGLVGFAFGGFLGAYLIIAYMIEH